ncbi:hypothetical protein PanWU01x14_104940, partial [Parasponia andersonii]
ERPKFIKSQALADLLAQFPQKSCDQVNEELPREFLEMMACEKEDREDEWTITFDGSSTSKGEGAGIIVTNLKKNSRDLAYKLLEYELLVLGVSKTLRLELEK